MKMQIRRFVAGGQAGMGTVLLMAAISVGYVGVAPGQTSSEWTNMVSGGLWSDPGNWEGGVVADGAGAAAYFDVIDITADNTVHLDSPRTLRLLVFMDIATNTPANWILDNNGSPANILTLAGTAPTLSVASMGTDGLNRGVTIGAQIAGTNGFSKTGSGLLSLTASNLYSGPTTVGAGVLSISDGGALGDTNSGTTVSSAGGGQLRLNGGITVAEPLSISGSGAFPGATERRGALRSHTGSNIYTGPITVFGASETWISGGALTIKGGITGTNATLRFDQGAPIVVDNPINLGSGGSLLVNSSLRLGVTGNTFGTVRADWGGTIITEVANALPTSVTLSLGTTSNPFNASSHNGALNLFGNDQTVGRLMDGGTTYVGEVIYNSSAATATLTVNQAVNSTYLGRMTGNVALTKGGVGVLTLGGSNTYTGTTTIDNGTLIVNGRHLGGGQYVLDEGGTLGGTGLISGALAGLAGGIVAPGNAGAIGQLTLNGSAELAGVLNIHLSSSGLGSADLLSVTGTLDISSATVDFDLLAGALDDDAYVFATYGQLVGTFDSILDQAPGYLIDYAYGGNQIALVIPEPSALVLFTVGAVAVILRRRRRS